jgi:membrane protein YdbS with pleckstrin-like domain
MMEAQMETLMIKPNPNLKKVWFIGWIVLFVILAVGDYLLITLLREAEPRLILGIMISVLLGIWLLVLPYLPVFFNSLEYRIESDSISGKKGVFWRKTSTVPYHKITNIDVTQGPLQRMFDIGNIHCQTAGAGGPQGAKAELVLRGIFNPEETKNTISVRLSKKPNH